MTMDRPALLISAQDKSRKITRRRFVQTLGAWGMGGFFLENSIAATSSSEIVKQPFANGERRLVTFPQKRPLILLTTRPPQLETPFPVFNQGLLTPNDAFFVRYHLSGVPTSIDPDKFSLTVR